MSRSEALRATLAMGVNVETARNFPGPVLVSLSERMTLVGFSTTEVDEALVGVEASHIDTQHLDDPAPVTLTARTTREGAATASEWANHALDYIGLGGEQDEASRNEIARGLAEASRSLRAIEVNGAAVDAEYFEAAGNAFARLLLRDGWVSTVAGPVEDIATGFRVLDA